VLPGIHLSLTNDHQVVNEAPGADFLQDIFEQPGKLLQVVRKNENKKDWFNYHSV
jgi:hypothetical protein